MGERFRTETAAHIGCDDTHALRRKSECFSDVGLNVVRSLIRIVERNAAVLPNGDRRMRLHRIVVNRGRSVRRFELHRRRGKRAVGIAVFAIGREARIYLIGLPRRLPRGTRLRPTAARRHRYRPRAASERFRT